MTQAAEGGTRQSGNRKEGAKRRKVALTAEGAKRQAGDRKDGAMRQAGDANSRGGDKTGRQLGSKGTLDANSRVKEAESGDQKEGALR